MRDKISLINLLLFLLIVFYIHRLDNMLNRIIAFYNLVNFCFDMEKRYLKISRLKNYRA